VEQATADFYADVDDLVWGSLEDGFPLTREDAIKKLTPVYSQLLGKSLFDIALNNSNLFSQAGANFDTAVEDFVETAEKAGYPVDRDIAKRRLEPFFGNGAVKKPSTQ